MPGTTNEVINTDEKNSEFRRNPSFWAFHPIGRGVGAGLVCDLFSTTPAFSTGFIYGALSGSVNMAIRPLVKDQLEKTKLAPEHKALAAVTAVSAPWAVSAGIMHQLHRISGRSLFKVNPVAAVASAIAVEYMGYANDDLLGKKPKT